MKFLLLLFASLSLFGQAKDTSPRFLGSFTVATLPAAASWSGYVAVVTDASFAGSCTVGGGSAKSLCRSTGSAWESLGGSSPTAGPTGAITIVAGVIDIDTAYVPSKTNLYAVTGRGTFANLPTCNSTASVRTYWFTDSYYEAAHCDGSSWVYVRDGQSYTQPTGLSAISGTTATTSTTNGGTKITFSNTNRIEAFTATNFAGATKTVTACWLPLINLSGTSYEIGIALRESATSKVVLWSTFSESNRYKMNRAYWTNSTTWASNGVVDSGYMTNSVVCARVRKASSNLNYEVSSNGIDWITLNTTTLTAHFTTDADESGVGGVANGALVPVYGAFIHYAVN